MNAVVVSTIEETADILFSISEKMLKREKPFDDLVLDNSIASIVFLNYLKYENDLEQKQKETLMENFICKSRHLIKQRMIGKQPNYSKTYSELFNTEDQFIKWYFAKQEMPTGDILINMHELKKLNIKQIIKDEVEKHHPQYFLEKVAKKRSTARFSRRITDSLMFVVYFNIGIKRRFFNVEIGLNNPSFLIDIGNLLARPQSMFNYENAEDIKNGVQAAIDFINSIDLRVFGGELGQ